MQKRLSRSLFSGLAAVAALLALALPARAVKTPVTLAVGDHAYAENINNLNYVFDGDLEKGVPSITGEAIRCNLAALAGNNEEVYVSRVLVTHEGNSNYSLYTSEDGEEWTLVRNAYNVRHEGKSTVTYYIASTVNWFKYVFESSSGDNISLWEIEFLGYTVGKPTNVVLKKSNLAKTYNADGTLTANNGTGGFGGGAGIGHWFDGNKKTNGGLWDGGGGTWLPNLGNGGWCQIDFTSVKPNGYFVTAISVSQCNNFKYSLYWTDDGTTWNAVDDAIGVSKIGEGIYNVNQIATQVRVVFDQTGGWTVNIAEIEVWGMDPDDVACTHPAYTEWTEVEGSATCLLPGIDERYCTICGARFTREQEYALGHDYMSHLEKPGKYKQFGCGYIECSRCGWHLDFPEDATDPAATMPLDLITNRVDGTAIGRVSAKGQFNFTEITVTSTGNGADDEPNWGVNPISMYDGHWGWGWQTYWYSKGSDRDPHVDFVFGTEIDLAWIEISVNNKTCSTKFYSVDDNTETETLLYDWSIEEIAEGTMVDEETGEEVVVAAPETQRTTIRFYEQPVKHLRIRQFTANGNVRVPMYISEVHPWGTVHGAGDLRYRKETIMILR